MTSMSQATHIHPDHQPDLSACLDDAAARQLCHRHGRRQGTLMPGRIRDPSRRRLRSPLQSPLKPPFKGLKSPLHFRPLEALEALKPLQALEASLEAPLQALESPQPPLRIRSPLQPSKPFKPLKPLKLLFKLEAPLLEALEAPLQPTLRRGA